MCVCVWQAVSVNIGGSQAFLVPSAHRSASLGSMSCNRLLATLECSGSVNPLQGRRLGGGVFGCMGGSVGGWLFLGRSFGLSLEVARVYVCRVVWPSAA